MELNSISEMDLAKNTKKQTRCHQTAITWKVRKNKDTLTAVDICFVSKTEVLYCDNVAGLGIIATPHGIKHYREFQYIFVTILRQTSVFYHTVTWLIYRTLWIFLCVCYKFLYGFFIQIVLSVFHIDLCIII